MTCPTCLTAAQLSANPEACLVDRKCAPCCVRLILRTIETLGESGDKHHAERIKDLLLEQLTMEGIEKWNKSESH